MSKEILVVGGDVPSSVLEKLIDIAAKHSKEVKTERELSVNVGAIGCADIGKSTLSAAISSAIGTTSRGKSNKSDRKRNRANRWN